MGVTSAGSGGQAPDRGTGSRLLRLWTQTEGTAQEGSGRGRHGGVAPRGARRHHVSQWEDLARNLGRRGPCEAESFRGCDLDPAVEP